MPHDDSRPSTQVQVLREDAERAMEAPTQAKSSMALHRVVSHAFETLGSPLRIRNKASWLESATGRLYRPGDELALNMAVTLKLPPRVTAVAQILKGAAESLCVGVREATEFHVVEEPTRSGEREVILPRSATGLLVVTSDGVREEVNGYENHVSPLRGMDLDELLPPPSAEPLGHLRELLDSGLEFDDALGGCGPTLVVLLLAYTVSAPRPPQGIIPVVMFLGPDCVGQTMAAMFRDAVMGSDRRAFASVDRYAQKDLEIAAANSLLLPLDGAAWSSDILPGVLRMLATGAESQRKRNYTDDELVTHRPIARPVVYGREVPTRKVYDDLSRAVPVVVTRAKEGFDPDALLRYVGANRPQLLADALELARCGLFKPGAVDHHGPLQSFESFALGAAARLGAEPEIREALRGLDLLRHELVLQDDPVAEALGDNRESINGFFGTSTELEARLELGIKPSVIGRSLARTADSLEAAYRLRVTPSRTSGRRGWRIDWLDAPDDIFLDLT